MEFHIKMNAFIIFDPLKSNLDRNQNQGIALKPFKTNINWMKTFKFRYILCYENWFELIFPIVKEQGPVNSIGADGIINLLIILIEIYQIKRSIL